MRRITSFEDLSARTSEQKDFTSLTEVKRFLKGPSAKAKGGLPLLSLCEFGDDKKEQGCIRHDGNVKRVHGAVIDYDGEKVSLTAAVAKLKKAGVEALVYTTARHKPNKPRWRVLAFLSKSVAPTRYREMVGRLNQVLDGVAAHESFVLSQSFYYGRVEGAPYDCKVVPGTPLDKLAIEPLYTSKATEAGEAAFDDTADDVFIEAFEKGEGRYDATLALTSRWISRGQDPEKVRAKLKKYVYHAERDGISPVTDNGENLYKSIDRLVDSAIKKFGKAKPLEPEAVASDWIDLKALPHERPPPRFTIDRWLTYPNVALYAAHGGSGKSFVALEIAVRVALGISVFGEEVRAGSVIYISAEDDRHTLHGRLGAILLDLGIKNGDAPDYAKLDGKLLLRDATEDDTVVFEAPHRFGDEPVTTPRFRWLRKHVKQASPVLVVLDNAIDHYSGNENDRLMVRTFIRRLHAIAKTGQGCTVLLLAHVDVNTLREGEKGKGFSGSTAWHNSVRNLWTQYRQDGANVLELRKINYARPGLLSVIEWDDDAGKFRIGNTRSTLDTSRWTFRVLRILVAMDGAGKKLYSKRSNQTSVATQVIQHALSTTELRAIGADGVKQCIADLLASGDLIETKSRTANRKTVSVYKVTDTGRTTAANIDADDE
jgi:AAA domain